MISENEFIGSLRAVAKCPAARGLLDDAAILPFGDRQLVLTHDMIVEGVHFLQSDPAEDVAWKLLAVNLSDLAAKGARPLGVLMGYSLTGSADWDAEFLRGFEAALAAMEVPLLGGDTVSSPVRTLGLTAIGDAPIAPSRAGARPGDLVWASGTIGDAGAGLRIARGQAEGPGVRLERYRRPQPLLAAGQALAPLVSAMMDVSDGLLIDAERLAEASGVAAEIALERVPLSPELKAMGGDGREAVLEAATAGDDYELLFTASEERSDAIVALAASLGVALTAVGRIASGSGLSLTWDGAPVALPARLGYEHGGARANG